jgi:hypothetical protein
VCRFSILFAGPPRSLLFHHRHPGAIHEHIEHRNRLPHDYRQVQLHGAFDLLLVAGGEIRADGFCGPLHGLGGHL